MGGLPNHNGRQEETEESIPLKWEMREARDDFTAAICFDARHFVVYELRAKLYSGTIDSRRGSLDLLGNLEGNAR